MKPLCIDLFCGLGGWAEGFLAEGYDVVGFDIERRPYPGQLVLQDVLTLHGSQFRNAAVIVASPPCQAYSYMAMPWDLSKREIAWQTWQRSAKIAPRSDLTDLFDACLRIQQEAGIPLIVENVKGAQPWVGRAKWHYGSFYLWGDVPALMPPLPMYKGFGGSWFAQNHNTTTGGIGNPVDGTGLKWGDCPGKRFDERPKGNVAAHREGTKQGGSGPEWWRKPLEARRREATAIKNGGDWFGSGANCSEQRKHASRSSSRAAASALIAKIPFDLARHIAQVYKPRAIAA